MTNNQTPIEEIRYFLKTAVYNQPLPSNRTTLQAFIDLHNKYRQMNEKLDKIIIELKKAQK